MKKYLYLLAAALLLSVGTLAAGHLRVNGAREKMDIRETVLAGDPAAAAGLSVTCHTRDWDGHLLWDTAFTPGGAEQAETVFRLSGAGEEEPFRWSDSVQLEQTSDSFNMRGRNFNLDDQSNPYYLMRPVRDVASRTAAGEARTETVRLADYYESYPIALNTASRKYPNSSIDVYSGESAWLGEYFKVKVDETLVRVVAVEKDGAGQVVSISMDIGQKDTNCGGSLVGRGVITEQGIFLIAESVDVSGNPDGRLTCRDGPGVHLIRYREDREDESFESYVDLFEPRLFYPTGDGRALELAVSPDESELLLYTQEDGKLVLTVLDPATGEVLQRLDLLEQAVGNWGISVIEGDGLYLAVTELDRFSLVSRESGRYEQVLTGTLDMEGEEQSVFGYDPALAWDGERMAVATAGRYTDADIRAAVWDESGLCFLGAYRCGLARDPCLLSYPYARTPLSLAIAGI